MHLLVLDPSQGTAPLERALRSKVGWQARPGPHLLWFSP
jgi:hypothetical protein